jgi:hypothetical protein
MKISKATSADIREKLEILADEPDLLDDYGITAAQAGDLIASVPAAGGDWSIPDWATAVIKGELADMATIWRTEAHNENSASRAKGMRAARTINSIVGAL